MARSGSNFVKRKRFVVEYLKDFNGKLAAIRAGFSPKNAAKTAHLLLKDPQIVGQIAEVQGRVLGNLEVTVEGIVAEYRKIGYANMGDYIKVQADGTAYYDLSGLTKEQLSAIQEFGVDEYTEGKAGAKGNGKGETGRSVKRMRVKLHDKIRALDSLGKHLGMFVERNKTELTGKDGIPLSIQVVFVKPKPE